MVATDFSKFVASQQQDSDREAEWDHIRDEWLSNLTDLHERVVGFLEEYVRAGSISYSFSSVSLTEENLGTYVAPRMDIKIGKQSVVLEPVGTLMIGSRGRVNVVGSAGRAVLVLINKSIYSAADMVKVTIFMANDPIQQPSEVYEPVRAWKILTQTAQRQFVDLEKETFFSLLVEVANG